MKIDLFKHLSVGVGVCGAIALGNISSARAFNLYSITDLGIADSEYIGAYDVNDAGQVVGFFRIGDSPSRAFISQNGTMTDLSSLGRGKYHDAVAINEAGQALVNSTTYISNVIGNSFIWKNGTTTDLGDLGGGHTFSYDINDAGQVVGYSSTADGQRHAFLWQNGTITDLGGIIGDYGYVSQINEAGQVLGLSRTLEGKMHGFVWQNGTITTFSPVDEGYIDVIRINEAGQVVGNSNKDGFFSGFIWQNGIMTNLFPSSLWTEAADINESGQIIGSTLNIEDRNYAFIWQNGTAIDLFPNASPASVAGAYDINDSGQVIGFFGSIDGINASFLWENGKGVDLKNLIAPNSGWDYLFADKLNNKGQIVGRGYFQGQYRGFIMTPTDTIIDPKSITEPIPEPSSLIGSILGLGTLALTARRRLKSKAKTVSSPISHRLGDLLTKETQP